MKPTLILIASASAALRSLAVESAIPAAFPAERYEVMIAKSPFALATPPAPVAAAPEKNFADGWYVGGLGRYEGKDFVTIKSRDLGVQLSLYGDEPRDGVTLQKVEWSPSIGKSTVTIAKDGQTAKLAFNEAELQAAPAAPSAQPAGMIRPPGSNPGMIRPPIPRPVQPVIQPQQIQPQQYGGGLQNNNNLGVPKPNANGIAAPQPRSRIRVINNMPVQ